jgi:hypothetical protein
MEPLGSIPQRPLNEAAFEQRFDQRRTGLAENRLPLLAFVQDLLLAPLVHPP